jgi:hypothetical protein
MFKVYDLLQDSQGATVLLGGIALLNLIFLIIVIVVLIKMKKLKKKYETFMSKKDVDLETLLVQYANRVKVMDTQLTILQEALAKVEKRQQSCLQYVGVVRYNAIEHVGSDLSFAVALLDEKRDGVVFNGIYGRECTYTYAKPIKNAMSNYTLSDEEKEAIKKALIYIPKDEKNK